MTIPTKRVAVIPLSDNEQPPPNCVAHGDLPVVMALLCDPEASIKALTEPGMNFANRALDGFEQERARADLAEQERDEACARADLAEQHAQEAHDKLQVLTDEWDARIDAMERKQQDQRKAKGIKSALDALAVHEHHGELTIHEAPHPQDKEQLAAMEDEQKTTATGPLADDLEALGDLPAEFETGPAAMDPEKLKSRDSTTRNPVGVSMHEDD
jgi:hypothetical protein